MAGHPTNSNDREAMMERLKSMNYLSGTWWLVCFG